MIDKTAGDHYVGDISDKAVLEAFAEKVILENGGIDYLINNALPQMPGRTNCICFPSLTAVSYFLMKRLYSFMV